MVRRKQRIKTLTRKIKVEVGRQGWGESEKGEGTNSNWKASLRR